jgi:hypothetical protein
VLDQASIRAAQKELTPDRLIVLRYEDVVGDPEEAVAAIARLLGAKTRSATGTEDVPPLFQSWETWKEAALGEVVPGRANAWEADLDPSIARMVTAICARRMADFGYAPGPYPRHEAIALPLGVQGRRIKLRVGWRVKVARLEKHLAATL